MQKHYSGSNFQTIKLVYFCRRRRVFTCDTFSQIFTRNVASLGPPPQGHINVDILYILKSLCTCSLSPSVGQKFNWTQCIDNSLQANIIIQHARTILLRLSTWHTHTHTRVHARTQSSKVSVNISYRFPGAIGRTVRRYEEPLPFRSVH